MPSKRDDAPVAATEPAHGVTRVPDNGRRRLRGAVAHYLGSAIVSGRIAPGERLTGEVENAEALDVSRSAYREAVQVLTAKGLVESRPKAGTRVLPRSRWNVLDPALLAAERREKSDLKAMKEALARMRRFTLATEPGRTADRDFHHALLQATHNNAMVALSASIGAAVNWTTQFKQRSRALPRDPIPDHARVFDAIAASDGEAASEAMRALVDLALEDTRSSM